MVFGVPQAFGSWRTSRAVQPTVAFGDIAFEEAARTVELLAEQVMPAFSDP